MAIEMYPARRAVVIAAAVAALADSPPAQGQPRAAPIDLPFEQFTLPNGLRVVVHTDRKAPIVAVNIWYHVGSKNEPRGRSGFAHLFEHVMFQGSENLRAEYFGQFERIGATGQDGTTSNDRTNYFANVPTTALDAALWMESDRMGHLLGALDQAQLDEQRGVVQNEKRQGENQPYGRAFTMIFDAVFPDGHPYHHSAIGSMSDLAAATLDDVKSWFRSWYGPNNAVLVLAGDIDARTARDKVRRYFGDIPPSATIAKMAPRIAARTTATRQRVTDSVPQSRIYKVWNVPPFGTAELDRLQLLAHVLGGSPSSRLHRRLQFSGQLADQVSTFVFSLELASLFIVQVDVKAGVDPAGVDAAIEEEVARLVSDGPTAAEVAQARASSLAGFIRGIERLGGFGGKSDVLAQCLVFVGNPACYRTSLANLERTTAAPLRSTARTWLRRGAFTLQIDPGDPTPLPEEAAVARPSPAVVARPAKHLRALPSTVDRTLGPPRPESFPPLRFPALTRATLSNGLQVVLAERRGLPLVQMSLELRGAGFASDRGRKPGTAAFTLAMLEEGAGSHDALAFAARKESLGAMLGTTGTIDLAALWLSAVKHRLDDSLALLADLVARPRLDPRDIERKRGAWLASLKQEKGRPATLARRIAGPALHGAGHPYAIPSSGTGTEEGIAALHRDDLTRWIADWVRPDHATLLVVGDTDLAELTPKLEKAFAGWKAPATPPPRYAIPTVAPRTGPLALLVDQPGAIQATILVGALVPSSMDTGAIDLELANSILGGTFSARLNMNLREDKHWSYGAYSQIAGAVGPALWTATTAVQIDKTGDALTELRREIVDYVTGKAPARPDELTKLQAVAVRALPGSYETGAAVLATLSDMVLYRRSDDYPQRRASRVEAITIEQLTAAMRAIQPTALTWVVVGDLGKIEAPIRALKLGAIKVVDPDGRVLR
jgi:zinc protease